MKLKKNTIQKLKTAELVAKKDLKQIKEGPRNPVFLILDNIRSMYNVGAIFRTADAAKVEKIFLCGITATPPRKEIEKTALKTIEYVPWEYREDSKKLVLELKDRGVQVIALEQTNTSANYKEFNFQKPPAEVGGFSFLQVEFLFGVFKVLVFLFVKTPEIKGDRDFARAGRRVYHVNRKSQTA